MRRSLGLLLFSVALLLQAAAPVLAAIGSDCLCAETACDDQASQPCATVGGGCQLGSCVRSLSGPVPVSHPQPGSGHAWIASASPQLTAHPPDSDLRPPIA